MDINFAQALQEAMETTPCRPETQSTLTVRNGGTELVFGYGDDEPVVLYIQRGRIYREVLGVRAHVKPGRLEMDAIIEKDIEPAKVAGEWRFVKTLDGMI